MVRQQTSGSAGRETLQFGVTVLLTSNHTPWSLHACGCAPAGKKRRVLAFNHILADPSFNLRQNYEDSSLNVHTSVMWLKTAAPSLTSASSGLCHYYMNQYVGDVCGDQKDVNKSTHVDLWLKINNHLLSLKSSGQTPSPPWPSSDLEGNLVQLWIHWTGHHRAK